MVGNSTGTCCLSIQRAGWGSITRLIRNGESTIDPSNNAISEFEATLTDLEYQGRQNTSKSRLRVTLRVGPTKAYFNVMIALDVNHGLLLSEKKRCLWEQGQTL